MCLAFIFDILVFTVATVRTLDTRSSARRFLLTIFRFVGTCTVEAHWVGIILLTLTVITATHVSETLTVKALDYMIPILNFILSKISVYKVT